MHEKYIRECFRLAKQGRGTVSPNPLVGSVIVKDDKVIAEGFHKKAGLDHAEADAFNNATDSTEGATLYCNLEPCCHTNKKTEPCAQRIIEEGITKVVISNLDPNPLVAGKGIQLLRDNGVEVICDILKEEGEILNEIFFTHITKGRPFIHLKWAQTLDGKMSTMSGDSKWITSETSRANVHLERDSYDAIMIGANTLISDNPKLTVRIDETERAIKRVVLSNRELKESQFEIFNDEYKDKSMVLTHDEDNDLNSVLNSLYLDHGVCSIYVEGGARTIGHFLRDGLFDKVSVYISPKILGSGKSPLMEMINMKMSDSLEFTDITWMSIEEEILMSAYKKE